MSACLVLALSAATLPPAPDSTLSPVPARQLIKLGVHGFDPGFVSLGYERQLSAQWSVVGSVGYAGYSYQVSSVYYTSTGQPVWEVYREHQRHYALGAQLRHYFASRRPRPLTGWYAAANVQVAQINSRSEYTQGTQYNSTRSRNSAQLQVLAGRQWALGRRLTLDSYVGLSMQERSWLNTVGAQSVWIDGGLGLQVGYRFRPLPR